MASIRRGERSWRRRDFPSRLKQSLSVRSEPPLATGGNGGRGAGIATFHAHNENYFFPDAMA
jgi:hypothetical protein